VTGMVSVSRELRAFTIQLQVYEFCSFHKHKTVW